MSCTRRGFLKTLGAAMVGLGITRLDPLRTFAASSSGSAGETFAGGPAMGPFTADALRARAVDAARWAGDSGLADELASVCCWAPAATAIRSRPLGVQWRGAREFFRDFPGGDQLAQTLLYSNNTKWNAPRFRFDPDHLVSEHYSLLRRAQNGLRTDVITTANLNGEAGRAQLNLMLDRATGDRLAAADDRSEAMWASLSVLSGMMLDPTDELASSLRSRLSFRLADDRALGRNAAVRYNQIVLGSAQRAVWSDLLDDDNAALPLLKLSSAGYLPLGEDNGRFVLLRTASANRFVTGYRSGSA
jgi:hypothetical protein